jgi:predicted TIM-barrel fold metal-dependent hydrolase
MCFPSFPNLCGQLFSRAKDKDAALAILKAYNDWHVDEWCGAYPERFIPCGILPLFDVVEAAAEVRRLDDKGCHAVTFSENPAGLGMPSIHTDAWDPLFAACSDTGTVLSCHVGSSSKSASTAPDAPPPVPMNLSSAMSIFTLGDLLWADFWHRFPKLRFALTEGDIGWIPYFLQRGEHTLDRHNAWMGHEQPQGLRPSELFRERILCCFIEDRVGVKLLDEFNVDNVCWESDYPHSDSSWPAAPERLETLLADLGPEVVAKLTHGNAMRHYQFDPFRTRAPERCTVSALRAEAADVDTVTHVGRRADDRDLATWKQMTGAAARPRS